MATDAPSTLDKISLANHADSIRQLQATGHDFHQRGWSLATSSNYSCVVSRDPLRLLITASGKDKGRLEEDDFVLVDADGQPVGTTPHRSSAETLLHVVIARRRPEVGAVLHTHSVWGTFLSARARPGGTVVLEGFEMLKGLEHVQSHDHREHVPVFDNSQDIPYLAGQVDRWLASDDADRAHGFLIRRHGLYTWGRTIAEARRHVEAFEFLFECHGRLQMVPPA